MNDNDIIELMKVCSMASGCKSCRFADSTDCAGEVSAFALDLINRLKAEIERLNANMDAMVKEHKRLIADAKTSAIKEFADRLKNNIDLYQCIEEYYENAEICYEVRQDWFNGIIDNLVKETTEGEDGNV